MLFRCARGMMAGPVGLAAGVVLATGVAAGVALGAGMAGAAMIGRRMWEERQGWRASGAGSAGDDTMVDPAPEVPGA
jgi:hypothetical protein